MRRFVRLDKGIPVDDTFAPVLWRIAPRALQACLVSWAQALCERSAGEVIATDGKTVRRSHDRRQGRGPLHLVRAWATQAGLALGQVATEVKSNEIVAIPALLRYLELCGALVTIDAMGCQRDIAEQIVTQGGDYVLAVKANQPGLYDGLVDFFDTTRANDFRGVTHIYFEQTDAGHGRIEVRRRWASGHLDGLAVSRALGGTAEHRLGRKRAALRWADQSRAALFHRDAARTGPSPLPAPCVRIGRSRTLATGAWM